MSEDSPDVVAAKRILDNLKRAGFRFQRSRPGEDGPLLGQRLSGEWADIVYIEGFSHDCVAWRQRRSPLIIPGVAAVERQVSGGALAVLGEVSTWTTQS